MNGSCMKYFVLIVLLVVTGCGSYSANRIGGHELNNGVAYYVKMDNPKDRGVRSELSRQLVSRGLEVRHLTTKSKPEPGSIIVGEWLVSYAARL